MSGFDRMGLIEEIGALAAELGVTDLPLLERLEDRPDNFLVNLRDVLQLRVDEVAERVGVLV